MIIDKRKIIEKAKGKKCAICNLYITDDDLYTLNCEYLKSKHGEKYFHSCCFENLLRKEK